MCVCPCKSFLICTCSWTLKERRRKKRRAKQKRIRFRRQARDILQRCRKMLRRRYYFSQIHKTRINSVMILSTLIQVWKMMRTQPREQVIKLRRLLRMQRSLKNSFLNQLEGAEKKSNRHFAASEQLVLGLEGNQWLGTKAYTLVCHCQCSVSSILSAFHRLITMHRQGTLREFETQ